MYSDEKASNKFFEASEGSDLDESGSEKDRSTPILIVRDNIPKDVDSDKGFPETE